MKDDQTNIENISKLMRWFFSFLIRSDEDTYAEIARKAPELNPAAVAVVMSIWKVIIHHFSLSAETHKLVSNLYRKSPPSKRAKDLFFKTLEELYREDAHFATTLDTLYWSSETIHGYVQTRLHGDASTDAPPPKEEKKRKGKQ